MPKRKSSRIKKFENEELERATVEKYRRINEKTDVSMILFRLNAWKKSGRRKKGGVFDNPEDAILDKYEGRVDFEVNEKFTHYTLSSQQSLEEPSVIYCKSDTVSVYHCTIIPPSYPDDIIWISDNGPCSSPTYNNGKRIPRKERISLVDGDIISLGIPVQEARNWGGNNKEGRGFVFKVKSLKRWKDDDDDHIKLKFVEDTIPSKSPRFSALNNNVILSQILGFLSHRELQTPRLVNKFWKGETDMKIFPQTGVSICDYNGKKDDWGMEFCFNASMIEKYKLRDWKIILGKIWKDEQFYNNVKLLLRGSGNLVRTLFLDLSADDESKDYWTEFLNILRNTVNVERLELVVNPVAKSPPVSEVEVFHSVQHLNLSGHFAQVIQRRRMIIQDKATVLDIFLQAAKWFPNLQGVSCDMGVFGGDVLECIVHNNLWANTLKEITCGVGGCTDRDDSNRATIFNMTQALSPNLNKLKLHWLKPFSWMVEVDSFYNMLERHAGTLEHLELGFHSWARAEAIGGGLVVQPVWRLPSLPKLKTLVFLTRDQKCYKLQIAFPSGQISYERDLPEIRVLQLAGECQFSKEYKTENVLRYFIPKKSETVSISMRRVKFFVKGEKRENETGWYKRFAKRFRKMFPNVHHPDVENVDLSNIEEESSDDEEGSNNDEDSESDSDEDQEGSESSEN